MADEPLPPGFVLDEALPPGFTLDQPGQESQQPAAVNPQLRDIAIALAKHIFLDGSPLGAAKDIFGTLAGPDIATAKGFGAGLVRKPVGPDASLDERAGNAIGRAAPVVGGIAAATALAPVAAPAVAAMLPSALGSLAAPVATGLASATNVGLGAMAGNTAQQIGAKVSGGEAPESLGAAAKETGKVGLHAALYDLGVGLTVAGVKAVTPTILQTLDKIPAESLKRLINNPDAVVVGSNARAYTELNAAKALRDAQRAIENVRQAKGEAVDAALTGFGTLTKNKPVIDTAPVVQAVNNVLQDASAGNAAVAAALPPGELSKIRQVLGALERKPMLSAKDAVNLRRAVDNLTAFKKGGAVEVSSDIGQRAVKTLGAELRSAIDTAADKAGYTALKTANQDFSRFAELYSQISPIVGTKTTDAGALIRQVKKIAGQFNEGGLPQRNIDKIAQRIPEAANQINKMLDMIAARELTRRALGTPSGTIKDAFRLLTDPRMVAVGIKTGSAVTPAIRAAAGPAGGLSAAP